MKQVRKKDYAFFKTGNYDLFDVLKLHIAASSLYYTICSPDGAIVLGETDQYLLANVINRIGQILLIANDYSHSAFSYPPPTGHSCNNLCHPAGATVRRPSPAGGRSDWWATVSSLVFKKSLRGSLASPVYSPVAYTCHFLRCSWVTQPAIEPSVCWWWPWMGLADSCCLEFMGSWDVQRTTALQGLSSLGRLSPAPSQCMLFLPVNLFSGSYCYIHKLSYLLNPFTQSDTEGASMTISLEML